MFTGIVQGLATVAELSDRPGLRSFTLAFPAGFDTGLEIGASVACDGVCLTVTRLPGPGLACFDVMQQSLGLTTLGALAVAVSVYLPPFFASHLGVSLAAVGGAWAVVRRIDEILSETPPRPDFRPTTEDDALDLEDDPASAGSPPDAVSPG